MVLTQEKTVELHVFQGIDNLFEGRYDVSRVDEHLKGLGLIGQGNAYGEGVIVGLEGRLVAGQKPTEDNDTSGSRTARYVSPTGFVTPYFFGIPADSEPQLVIDRMRAGERSLKELYSEWAETLGKRTLIVEAIMYDTDLKLISLRRTPKPGDKFGEHLDKYVDPVRGVSSNGAGTYLFSVVTVSEDGKLTEQEKKIFWSPNGSNASTKLFDHTHVLVRGNPMDVGHCLTDRSYARNLADVKLYAVDNILMCE